MDRTLLLKLFMDGMRYPPGTRQLWVTRCFDVTVHPGQVVTVDEYENAVVQEAARAASRTMCCRHHELHHAGRSVLDLRTGLMTEHPGTRQPRGH